MAVYKGTPNSVYVWYFQREDKGFSPFPVDVSRFLENMHSKGVQRIDLKDIPDTAKQRHPYLLEYIVDTTTFQQIHKDTGRRLYIERRNQSVLEAEACGGEWSWELGYGQFVLYDIQATMDLERSYQQRRMCSTFVDLSRTTANIPYTVHFTPDRSGYMYQVSNVYGTRRKVLRWPLDMPLQYYLNIPYVGNPPAVMSTIGGPPTIMSITGGPPTAMSTTGGPPTAMSTTGGPPTAMSTTGGPPTAMSTTGGPPTAMSTTGGPPTAVSTTGGPPTAMSTTGGHSSFPTTVNTRKHHPMAKSPRGPSLSYSPVSSLSSSVHGTSSHSMSSRGTSLHNTTNSQSVFVNLLDDENVSSSCGPPRHSACCTVPLTEDMTKYVSRVRRLPPDQDEPCPVCLCKLSEDSDYSTPGSGLDVVQMKCAHMLHRTCFEQYLKSSTTSDVGLRCPTCKKIHGIKMGDMPIEHGRMTVTKQQYSLPGHTGCGTIEITYHFSSGQDQTGRNFNAYSFPRRCYLPDSAKGNKVLKLLQVAWERKLTFTIGTSVTTGATNTIVWNEIHHKTENHSNASGHGYPDPNYLDNVLLELESQGVTEDSLQ